MTDKIQVADIYTTTPSIADNDLVVLEDPKNNFKAQQVLPLYTEAKVTDKAKEVLNSVSTILTTEDLINLNRRSAAPRSRMRRMPPRTGSRTRASSSSTDGAPTALFIDGGCRTHGGPAAAVGRAGTGLRRAAV